MSGTLLFYDGVCGLCNRLVQFVLRRDHAGVITLAALQSDFASELLRRHGKDPTDLDTLYVVLDAGSPKERLLSRSTAVIVVAERLGYRSAALLYVVPRPLRDLAYAFVAKVRYRLFGRYDACPLPPPEMRARFVDRGGA